MKISFILPFYNRLPYLAATLGSFEHFYCERQGDTGYAVKDFEVIIVDDGSDPEHRVEDLVEMHSAWMDIRVVRLENKNGVNPCYPYNVGVRHSTGDVLVLTSPETIHTRSIFALTNDFEDLTPNQYYCFSVFCPTRPDINEMALIANTGPRLQVLREKVENRAYSGLGAEGRDSFNNEFGSFYLHSKHRPTALNFLTAMRRELFYELSGFDERFRKGTGGDDAEFRDRLVAKIGKENVVYFDDALALHLNHAPAYGKGAPFSNEVLYNSLAQSPYLPNDSWGRQ